MGHGNGAVAALVAAARRPDLVRSLRLLRVPGYYPHTQEPAAVNAALREFWG
ncbi:hypothetical protein ACNFR7_05330 [Streptomyces sp. RM1]